MDFNSPIFKSMVQSIVRAALVGAAGAAAIKVQDGQIDSTVGLVTALLLTGISLGWSAFTHQKNINSPPPPPSTGGGNIPSAFLLAFLLGVGVASFASIGVTGCGTGQRVRNTVEVPALSFVAQAVEEDVQAGIAVSAGDKDLLAAESGAFFDAVRSKDRTQIRNEAWPRWAVIKALATDGLGAQVTSGTLSVEAAELGREQVRRFEGMLVQLVTP